MKTNSIFKQLRQGGKIAAAALLWTGVTGAYGADEYGFTITGASDLLSENIVLDKTTAGKSYGVYGYYDNAGAVNQSQRKSIPVNPLGSYSVHVSSADTGTGSTSYGLYLSSYVPSTVECNVNVSAASGAYGVYYSYYTSDPNAHIGGIVNVEGNYRGGQTVAGVRLNAISPSGTGTNPAYVTIAAPVTVAGYGETGKTYGVEIAGIPGNSTLTFENIIVASAFGGTVNGIYMDGGDSSSTFYFNGHMSLDVEGGWGIYQYPRGYGHIRIYGDENVHVLKSEGIMGDTMINFLSGKYVLDSYTDTFTFRCSSGSMSIDGGTVFDTQVNLNFQNLTSIGVFNGTIIGHAKSLTDYTYVNMRNFLNVISSTQGNFVLVLEEGFSAGAGDQIYPFNAVSSGATQYDFRNRISVKTAGGVNLVRGVDFDFGTTATTYNVITFKKPYNQTEEPKPAAAEPATITNFNVTDGTVSILGESANKGGYFAVYGSDSLLAPSSGWSYAGVSGEIEEDGSFGCTFAKKTGMKFFRVLTSATEFDANASANAEIQYSTNIGGHHEVRLLAGVTHFVANHFDRSDSSVQAVFGSLPNRTNITFSSDQGMVSAIKNPVGTGWNANGAQPLAFGKELRVRSPQDMTLTLAGILSEGTHRKAVSAKTDTLICYPYPVWGSPDSYGMSMTRGIVVRHLTETGDLKGCSSAPVGGGWFGDAPSISEGQAFLLNHPTDASWTQTLRIDTGSLEVELFCE